jgi:hypothetical protein
MLAKPWTALIGRPSGARIELGKEWKALKT